MFPVIGVSQKQLLKKIQDGDLYALLSICSKEDLVPIVEIILGASSNFLDICEEYKKYKPDYTKYYKKIGDEIRLFGGNTFKNIFIRDGEGIPYGELVADVCRKLDIPHEENDIVGNEDKLLMIYIEPQLKCLKKDEQNEILNEAQKKAKKDGIGLFTEASKLLAPRLLLGPAGWLATIPSLADPAFRVTIPCVIHIAYLRRKYLDEKLKHREPEQTTKEEANYSPISLNENALVIASSENETPVLSLIQIPIPRKKRLWKSVSLSDKNIGRLNQLLQSVPSIVTAENVANTKYMEVVINGDLARAADGIGYRGWSRVNGKFQEHARLFEADKLSNIVNAGAIWQIASVVVAQKHLADISEKLSEIKDGINEIIRHQKTERRARVQAVLAYFAQIAPSIIKGEELESFCNQLEENEKSLLEIQTHIIEDIKHLTKEEIKNEDMFGSGGIKNIIDKHRDKIKELYDELAICIKTRAFGLQLLIMYPAKDILKESRKQSIEKAINEYFFNHSDFIDNIEQFMYRNIDEKMNAHTNRKITINKRKLELFAQTSELIKGIKLHGDALVAQLRVAETAMLKLKKPVRCILKIEDNKIVEMCTD